MAEHEVVSRSVAAAPARADRPLGLEIVAGSSRRRRRTLLEPPRAPGPVPAARVPGAGAAPVWRSVYGAVLALCDVVAATVVVLTLRSGIGQHVPASYFAVVLLWPAIVWITGIYSTRFPGVGLEESARVGWAALTLLGVLTGTAYFADLGVPRSVPLLAAVPVLVVGLLTRSAARRVLFRLRARGHCLLRVVVVGDETSIASFQEQAAFDAQAGLEVAGACTLEGPARSARLSTGLVVLAGQADLRAAVESAGADLVAFTPCAGLDGPTIRRLTWQLEGLPVTVAVVPEIREVAASRLHARHISGLAVITVDQPAMRGPKRVVKNCIDWLGAFALLLALGPLMIVIALCVRATSEGPALFRQTRVKREGRTFTCLKFRSMHLDAESQFENVVLHNERPEGPHFKIAKDPRVTPLGRVLRRYSLDELPQLFNVLSGSMSLVGPRPPLPREVATYNEDTSRRLLVKPGLTGLWQVSGRASLTWTESLRMELRYVENWSLRLDLLILWKTAAAVLRGTGAY